MARYLQLFVPDLSMTQIEDFKKHFRTLEICIDNKTSEALSFIEGVFATGGMFRNDEHPRDVVPRTGSVYFLDSRFYFTGVSGGWKFKVVGKDLYLYIGFCNPLFGSYKTFVNLNKDGTLPAEWPYNKSMDNSVKTSESDEYIAEVTMTYPYYSRCQRMHYKIDYKEITVTVGQ